MHNCPECGQACYCELEDHKNEAAADECIHWLNCSAFDETEIKERSDA